MPQLPTLRQLMENGVHFGHTKSRWNPKMKQYIFATRENIHVINLEQTRQKLDEAIKFLQTCVERGGIVLFVGTKKQSKNLVKEAAIKCGMPYVSERWFGGELTNFAVLRKNVKVLEDIEQSEASGRYDHLTKKERLQIDEKKRKLLDLLSGVRDMAKVPDAMVVIDSGHDHIAIKEAKLLNIPVVAMVDTDSNPATIEYPIPANDDAVPAVTLILGIFSQAINEAKASRVLAQKTEEKEIEKSPEVVEV